MFTEQTRYTESKDCSLVRELLHNLRSCKRPTIRCYGNPKLMTVTNITVTLLLFTICMCI
jgi:hypothetical protein